MRKIACLILITLPSIALPDVKYVVIGLDETLTENVLSHVDMVQFGPRARFRPRDHDKVVEKSIADARAALRPFGYYAPLISVSIRQPQTAGVDVRVTGPGAEDRRFRAWLREWPLREGAVLVQPTWEDQKQNAVEIANQRGYLSAKFAVHSAEIDLEQNTANLKLEFDTGPRFVMGDVRYGEHGLKPGILEYIPRFEKGDFYTSRLVSRFRTDLWATGFFDDITVREIKRPELDPPAVDFDVSVATETRNHYSGALGWGDDTGIRVRPVHDAWSLQKTATRPCAAMVGCGSNTALREPGSGRETR
jgi:translocation and assembly module TamA